ncbi:phosphatase domain-containing protein [Aurantiacibacter sp. D1-12]|uniref:phosphatase domain-containing protein n=1 Tax=Aurantiacibacter sp. D1-12 TaxID=2993658 RepID=UPI00237CC34E|nr:phosphatase domain-containing protein [Aurantiacibacter sp. D1-12]MDE1468208.1 DUF2183 domain-containing protein [Aurantiacibacter sp. D1-12]
MVLSRSVATRIQPYFGYRNTTRLAVSARALRSPAAKMESSSRLRAIRTMLAKFSSREVAGVTVRLVAKFAGETVIDTRRETDAEGFVHFDEEFPSKIERPEHTAWESVTLEWVNTKGPQSIVASILAPASTARLGVISDIDDTIIESGITGGLRNIARNWRRVMAEMPTERIVVPGAADFYTSLGGQAPNVQSVAQPDALPAPSRPFFYVSSSPWNLFSYLVAFKKAHGLPHGPMMLRDWGLNRATFGSGSHGAHKRAAIASILATYPDMRFAMIGDDTQGDLPAFAEAAQAHPGQIAGVFLRKAAVEDFSPEERAAQLQLEKADIPLWLGESFQSASEFFETLGIESDHEAAQIVKTIEDKAE